MYSPSCPLSDRVRSLMTPQFGLWHTGKHCTEIVWKGHSRIILARLWHVVNPNQTLAKKPSLEQLLTFFVQLKIAYQSVMQLFQDDHDASKGSTQDRCARRIILDLFEWFLPLVSNYLCLYE